MRGGRRPIYAVAAWVRRQPSKVKAFLGVVAGMAALVFLRFIVHDHDNLFVAAEAVHAIGISVLIYKLTKERTCAGACLVFPFLLLFYFDLLWMQEIGFQVIESDKFVSCFAIVCLICFWMEQ